MKRAILVGCCTLATVVGPLAVASPAAANSCPYGTVARFDGVCTQGQSGGAPPPGITVPQQGASIVSAPGSIPSVNGIPCTVEHFATCYAMSQQP